MTTSATKPEGMTECPLHRGDFFDEAQGEVCPSCELGEPSDAEREAFAEGLFRLVEYDQGMSYISDGSGHLGRAEIIDIAELSLSMHRSCVRKLTKWLRKARARVDELHDDHAL